jgi:phage terminase large subunit
MLKKTTAQSKIAALKKRVRIVQGGTSSSKTFTIIPLLIDHAIKNSLSEISVVAESIPHLKRGAIKDFKKIMIWCGLWDDSRFNKSDLKYVFTNGSFIEFFSADQPDKLLGARRHVLFVNEANNINFEAYNHLAIRTSDFIYIDFNPTNEFWAHTELQNDVDTDFIILTYKDNEALDESIVKEIEKAREKAKTSSYWDNWWRVYGLGEIGSLEGVIFSNWKLIDKLPKEARLIGYGLDFGYSKDPTALVGIYQYNNQRILHEHLYSTGLVNSDIAKFIDNNVITYADSAEPKSIEEIRRAGKMIYPVKKGSDSINFGIQIIQQNNYLVTKESTNLIKELRSYVWDKNKTGEQLTKPVDYMNHAIDAWRYHEMMALGIDGNKGNYFVY